ncbi:nuclear transport factor 2 family protein [Desertivirga arenae]|uniref:nuclear transport factor 2 family protein n=1 Tax=Desertivirga arenae TaxID=2810309 RepID=UPI001F60FF43|nr:nuclear transport factor 2 family protein [Pedobacter sp. SYSU D00823]
MKTLKTLLTAFLMVITIGTFADELNTSNKLSIDYALKSYLDAVSEGKIKGFADVLDGDVKFTVTRGEKIVNYSKSEMLSSLKSSEGVKQNCTTEYAIVEQNSTQTIVRVTQKYEEFTRINFVTFNNTSKGWKITNVSSSFS